MDELAPVFPSVASFLREIGVAGFIDIAVMALVIHAILVWLRKTRRAAAVLIGMLIVAGFYLLARQFDLRLTAAVLQGFFAVILVALVVIFQEELRYLFERIAQWGLKGRRLLAGRRPVSPYEQRVDLLVRTLTDLAAARHGAILVLCGSDTIARHVEGGQSLNGDLSEAILKSVFDPHSIGHDGAAVIDRDVVREFGCHLPLSKNRAEVGDGGTRHAAALGLSELTDALCLVVSEEKGTISAARHGKLQVLRDARDLERRLTAFYADTEADADARPRAPWTSRLREKAVALVLAVALWFVLVHESQVVYRTYRIPVALGQTRPELVAAGWNPAEVEVTFSAPRKSFYFAGKREFRMAAKVWDLDAGESRLVLHGTDFVFPSGLSFESVRPREITIRMQREGASPATPAR